MTKNWSDQLLYPKVDAVSKTSHNKMVKETESKASEGISALKNHIYTIAAIGKQADQYTKTTKAIGDYAGRVYGHDMKMLVTTGKDNAPKEPTYPAGTKPSDKDKAIWGKKYDHYLREEAKYKDNKAKVFNIILSQCDKAMRNRVEATADFESHEQTNDVAGLLRSIKDIAFDSNEKKYPSMQAAVAWRNLAKAWQQDNEDLNDYYKRFMSLTELVDRLYGPVAPVRIAEKDSQYQADKEAVLKKEQEKMLAFMFMDGANKKIYGALMRKLHDDHSLGDAKFPDTIEEALQVLSMKGTKSLKQRGKSDVDEGTRDLSFTQMSKTQLRKKGLCFKCGKKGHMAKDCPKEDEESVNGINAAQTHEYSWMR